jgi:hypothetical protein
MSGAAVTRAIMRCAITVGVWRVLVTARGSSSRWTRRWATLHADIAQVRERADVANGGALRRCVRLGHVDDIQQRLQHFVGHVLAQAVSDHLFRRACRAGRPRSPKPAAPSNWARCN